MKKYNFVKKHKWLVGISSIILGGYMVYSLKNKFGLVLITLGIGVLLWRFK